MLEKLNFDIEPKTPELQAMKRKFEEDYQNKISCGMTDYEIKLERVKAEVERDNAKAGNLFTDKCPIDCKICKNKGVIYFAADDGNGNPIEYSRECDCMKARYAYNNIVEQGLFEVVQCCTFDSFKAETDLQKNIKEKALRYANSDLRNWFFVGGQSGSGKTHICSAIVGELLKKAIQVIYMPYEEVARELAGSFYDPEEYKYKINYYKKADILYIDDFLKNVGKTNTNEMRIVFELIDYRYKNHFTTIISSEFTAEKMMSLDSALFGRIKERAKEFIVNIGYDEHKNYRLG